MAQLSKELSSWQKLVEATRDARENAFAQIGTLSPHLRMKGLLPSFFRNESLWPATVLPSLRLVERGQQKLFVTNGLSDPFDPEIHEVSHMPEVGCACEFFAETNEENIGNIKNEDGLAVKSHWLEWVLWNIADWEAKARAAYDMAGKFGQFTLQIPPCRELESWQLPNGYIAVLIGQSAPGISKLISLPKIEAELLAVKVLLPDEYEYAVSLGNDGSIDLAQKFATRGDYHLNWLSRPSVLSDAL